MPLDVQWLGRISWQDAYALQEKLVEQRIAGEITDTVLLLEHEPVITIGRTPDKTSLLSAEQTNVQVIETNRGGRVTYHGLGQIVGYPIISLSPDREDVHRYVRDLEEVYGMSHYKLGLGVGTGIWKLLHMGFDVVLSEHGTPDLR